MAWADGRVSTWKLLRNWGIVYVGNFVGAIATALLVFFARQYTFGGGAVGLNMLNIAEAKTGLAFGQAIALGMLCNGLVCSGRLALLQRPHHHRQDPVHPLSGHRLRGSRLRA